MTRHRHPSQHGLLEEQQKVRRPSRTPAPGVRHDIPRQPAGALLQLQRTAGNQAVTRLLTDQVQRQPPEEELPMAPTTAKTGPTPGAPVPIPYPNQATAPKTAGGKVKVGGKTVVTGKSKMTKAVGDEPGTLKGTSTGAAAPGATQRPVVFTPGVAPEEEPAAGGSGSGSQMAEEEEAQP